MQTSPENEIRVRKILKEQWEQLDTIRPEEVEWAKVAWLLEQERRLGNLRVLALTQGYYELLGLEPSYTERVKREIERMSPGSLREVAQRYLMGEEWEEVEPNRPCSSGLKT